MPSQVSVRTGSASAERVERTCAPCELHQKLSCWCSFPTWVTDLPAVLHPTLCFLTTGYCHCHLCVSTTQGGSASVVSLCLVLITAQDPKETLVNNRQISPGQASERSGRQVPVS